MMHHHLDRIDMLMIALAISCIAYLVYAVWVLPNEDERQESWLPEEEHNGAEK